MVLDAPDILVGRCGDLASRWLRLHHRCLVVVVSCAEWAGPLKEVRLRCRPGAPDQTFAHWWFGALFPHPSFLDIARI